MMRARILIGLSLLTLAACGGPPPPATPPRTSNDMIDECQRVLRQGYTTGFVDNPRATFKQMGELTTVELSAVWRTDSDPRGQPVGYRCLFEKGRLFQAGAAIF